MIQRSTISCSKLRNHFAAKFLIASIIVGIGISSVVIPDAMSANRSHRVCGWLRCPSLFSRHANPSAHQHTSQSSSEEHRGYGTVNAEESPFRYSFGQSELAGGGSMCIGMLSWMLAVPFIGVGGVILFERHAINSEYEPDELGPAFLAVGGALGFIGTLTCATGKVGGCGCRN